MSEFFKSLKYNAAAGTYILYNAYIDIKSDYSNS